MTVEAVDLLPMVLDDDLCIAFGIWRKGAKDVDLDKALNFLSSWLVQQHGQSNAMERFSTRKWQVGEPLERYETALEALAEACYIKSGEKAFKLRFVEGLPETIKPIIRSNLQGDNWPTVQNLIERVRLTGVVPMAPMPSISSVHQQNAPTYHPSAVPRQIRPCYNCGRMGHLARDCRARQATHQAGKGQSSWGRPTHE